MASTLPSDERRAWGAHSRPGPPVRPSTFCSGQSCVPRPTNLSSCPSCTRGTRRCCPHSVPGRSARGSLQRRNVRHRMEPWGSGRVCLGRQRRSYRHARAAPANPMRLTLPCRPLFLVSSRVCPLAFAPLFNIKRASGDSVARATRDGVKVGDPSPRAPPRQASNQSVTCGRFPNSCPRPQQSLVHASCLCPSAGGGAEDMIYSVLSLFSCRSSSMACLWRGDANAPCPDPGRHRQRVAACGLAV